MSLVGTAEVLIVPSTAGFEDALKRDTEAGLTGFRQDAEAAGEDAGSDLRTGMSKETGKIEKDLGDVGNASGLSLRKGVTEGSKGLENDLGDLGSLSGTSLRKGVTDESGKLAEDLERDGAAGGEGLHRGLSSGLSKVASVLGATGLPLENLTTGFEKSADAAEHAGEKSDGLAGSLSHLGGIAAVGLGAVLGGVALEGVHLAEGMQSADAAMAAAAGTSVSAAAKIGNAFLDTGGKTEFSGEQIATAFAGVAGQLKSTEGHALDSSQALQVMDASMDLATAKGISLGDSTSTVAGIMQAFKLQTGDAAHVSDVLFTASTATGQSVDALGNSLEKVRAKLGPTAGSVGDLAGLLVDMTDQGVTGRAAMTGLSTGMNTLEKSANGVTTATGAQKAAYDQMSPSLQKLADEYKSGSISSAAFTTATDALPPAQANLANSFATATVAVQDAQLKFKEMGVTAFDTSGKFVGMGSIIEQLHPKFAQMSQDQQLAASTTLFGAGAARQMMSVIDAGPAAYDAATASVNKMGSAHAAAAKQADTLHVEEETLKAEFVDVGTKIGEVLIPAITAMVGWFVKATSFVMDHKAALIALAAVVTGVLGTAIAVFTVNKMASFGQSFISATGHVKDFASGVQTAVQKVIGLFTQQTEASTAAGLAVEENAAKSASATTAASDTIETDNATASASMKGVGAAAGTAADEVKAATVAEASATTEASDTIETDNATAATSIKAVGTAAGTAAGEVTTADGTIEGDNAKAAASFGDLAAGAEASDTALVGPLGTEVSEIGGADTAIEAENAAAAASFNKERDAALVSEAEVAAGAGAAGGLAGRLSGALDALKPFIGAAGVALGLQYAASKVFPTSNANPGSSPTTAPLPNSPGGSNSGSGTNLGLPGPGGSLIKTVTGLLGINAATQGPGFASGAPLSSSALADNTTASNAQTAATQKLTATIAPLASSSSVSGEMQPGGLAAAAAGFPKMTGSGNIQANTAAPSSYTPTTFAIAVLQGLGITPSTANVRGLTAWEAQEGGNWNNSAKYNPLNTTQPEPGYSTTGAQGNIGSYTSWAQGLQATLATLEKYPGILAALKSGASVGGLSTAVGTTHPTFSSTATWGTGSIGAPGVTLSAAQLAALTGGAKPGTPTAPAAPTTPSGIAAMLAEAQALVGTPYSHAGDHSGTYESNAVLKKIGVDCSAFVSAVLHGGGVNLPGGPQNTTGLAKDLVPGKGPAGGVTVYDRANAGADSHALIDIAGHYYMSGGSTSVNPSSKVTALTAAQANAELHDGGAPFLPYHPANIPGGNTVTPGSTPTAAGSGTPSLTSAQKLAQARTALSAKIIQETAAVDKDIAAIEAKDKGGNAAQKQTGAAQIAALRAALATEINQQRGALASQTAAQSAEQKKQTSDLTAGTSLLNKMLTAIHSGSLSSLKSALEAAHIGGLSKIEAALDHDHSSALSALSAQLVKVHTEAMNTLTKETYAANAAADAKLIAAAQVTVTNAVDAVLAKQATAITKTATDQATQTADATQVYLDQQAESGLTGAALTAAQAQTSFDQIKQTNDAAVAVAQAGVDAVVNGTTTQQDLAAVALANAQGAATTAEAGAQSVLDEANAAASAASAAASAASTAATTAASAAAATATQGNTLIADQAKQQADQIADSTKVYLDQQAETGLTGAALLAAQAQTGLDTVTMQQNQAIDSAQQAVDQAASGDATAQAAASSLMAQTQATATVQEATAQSVLDKANAAASAASSTATSTSSTVTNTTAAPTTVTNNFYISGNGQMTASQLLSEVAWSITTGALPVAPPPVPAAA